MILWQIILEQIKNESVSRKLFFGARAYRMAINSIQYARENVPFALNIFHVILQEHDDILKKDSQIWSFSELGGNTHNLGKRYKLQNRISA